MCVIVVVEWSGVFLMLQHGIYVLMNVNKTVDEVIHCGYNGRYVWFIPIKYFKEPIKLRLSLSVHMHSVRQSNFQLETN